MAERSDVSWLAWLQAGLGVLALILGGASVVQANANRALQATAAANQARLQRATTFANLDNGLVQLLAKSAADTNDAALTDLLQRNGITFRRPPSSPAGAGTTP